MTYIVPKEFSRKLVDAGEAKLAMATRDAFIRGVMAGAILAVAAAFAVMVSLQTGYPIAGALVFPVGFCMLTLLGYDLVTGAFMLTPLAWLDGRPGATVGAILRHWGVVFTGNFAGALLVAVLLAFVYTYGFSVPAGKIGSALAAIGESRTLGYAEHGVAGWFTIFLRGVLCNWMVALGVVGAMMSASVSGKVIAMWMPILLFFGMGFEHSVVNMFLFPMSLMLGGDFSVLDYFLWNEIPVLLGNLLGGLSMTGLALYVTHVKTAPSKTGG